MVDMELHGAGGGSGYIGGVPSFKHTNGTTYSPSTTAGQNNGNGQAKITFVAFSEPPSSTYDTNIFTYTGGIQTYTVPRTGVYKLEVSRS